MENIAQEKFIELAKTGDYEILDVRTAQECAEGMIPGAKEINFMDQALFSNYISELDKDKKYLIYCRSGNRSGQACMMMDSLGFSDTYNLIGGMLHWRGEVVK